MLRTAIIGTLVILLAGCDERCPIKYEPGTLVKHRLLDLGRMIVVQSLAYPTFDSTCFVIVRAERDGELHNLAGAELEPAQ